MNNPELTHRFVMHRSRCSDDDWFVFDEEESYPFTMEGLQQGIHDCPAWNVYLYSTLDPEYCYAYLGRVRSGNSAEWFMSRALELIEPPTPSPDCTMYLAMYSTGYDDCEPWRIIPVDQLSDYFPFGYDIVLHEVYANGRINPEHVRY